MSTTAMKRFWVVAVLVGWLAGALDATRSSGQTAQLQYLPLGSISATPTACATQVATGATCYSMTETCPNTDVINGQIAVATPAGTPAGTIVLIGGKPIGGYFGAETGSGGADQFANSFLGLTSPAASPGFNTVQVTWLTDPGTASASGAYPNNMRAAWCRGATLIRWAYDHVHLDNLNKGFCVMAHSEGGCFGAGALTYYGAYQYVDFFLGSTNPVCGDFYKGCTCTSGCSNAICAGDSFSYKMPAGSTNYPATWLGVGTCQANSGAGPFYQGDAAVEIESSLDNPAGATFTFPQTGVHTYQAYQSDEEPAQAMFWLNQLTVMGGGGPTTACYSNSVSDGEAWWTTNGTTPTTAYATAVNDMIASCVPNH